MRNLINTLANWQFTDCGKNYLLGRSYIFSDDNLSLMNEEPDTWRFDGIEGDIDDSEELTQKERLEETNDFWFERLDSAGEPTEDYRVFECPFGFVGDQHELVCQKTDREFLVEIVDVKVRRIRGRWYWICKYSEDLVHDRELDIADWHLEHSGQKPQSTAVINIDEFKPFTVGDDCASIGYWMGEGDSLEFQIVATLSNIDHHYNPTAFFRKVKKVASTVGKGWASPANIEIYHRKDTPDYLNSDGGSK